MVSSQHYHIAPPQPLKIRYVASTGANFTGLGKALCIATNRVYASNLSVAPLAIVMRFDAFKCPPDFSVRLLDNV